MRILLVGPGAVGLTAAAHLAAQGHPVEICARRSPGSVTVAAPEGLLPLEADVHLHPEAVEPGRPGDLVLLATKAHQTAGAGRWLERLTGPGVHLLVLQNGVEHRDRVAGPVHPETLVLPVVVDCPASRPDAQGAPGQVRQHRAGSLTLPPAGRALARRLRLEDGQPGLHWAVSPDDAAFSARLWTKMVVNATGIVPTVTGQPARIFRRPEVAHLTHAVMAEAMAVAVAEQAEVHPDLPERVLRGLQGGDPERRPSIARDQRAGRAIELDARNGALVRLGVRHGVPTPVNAALVQIAEAMAHALTQ